ncbi:MAG: TetR/AcrR family transcriptional regulator [Oligoflexia bacterium]|nr:TetR/AcrR family transcriptional regulator [Oligoflexia bacterium]
MKKESISKRKLQWQDTHRKILSRAGLFFKRKGFKATNIADLMRAENLTVGGFYSHFKSKNELLLSAVSNELSIYEEKIEHFHEENNSANYIKEYLSKTHRDHPENGCPISFLVCEIANLPEAMKKNISNLLKEALEKRHTQAFKSLSEEKALTLYCSMLGALLLARATKELSFSDQILEIVKQELLQIHSCYPLK